MPNATRLTHILRHRLARILIPLGFHPLPVYRPLPNSLQKSRLFNTPRPTIPSVYSEVFVYDDRLPRT
jgi:hypothetical protein